MAVYGYLNRTLINDRDDYDIAAMFRAVPGEKIVIEQIWSRGEESRPAFDKMLGNLMPGDVLYVCSIDRLGLDTEDAVRLWYYITREKNADIVVLNDRKLYSRENGNLTETQLRLSADTAFSGLDAKLHRKGVINGFQ